MRYSARKDGNQTEIATWFRNLGASVHFTHTLGRGFPDLVVGYRGHNLLIEIKTDRGQLTEAEIKWHEEWNGSVNIIRTLEEAQSLLEKLE